MTAQIYGIPQITVHYEETINDSTSNGNILASEEKNKGKDTNGEDSVDESYTSKKKISRVTPFQDYLKILRQVLEL